MTGLAVGELKTAENQGASCMAGANVEIRGESSTCLPRVMIADRHFKRLLLRALCEVPPGRVAFHLARQGIAQSCAFSIFGSLLSGDIGALFGFWQVEELVGFSRGNKARFNCSFKLRRSPLLQSPYPARCSCEWHNSGNFCSSWLMTSLQRLTTSPHAMWMLALWTKD